MENKGQTTKAWLMSKQREEMLIQESQSVSEAYYSNEILGMSQLDDDDPGQGYQEAGVDLGKVEMGNGDC